MKTENASHFQSKLSLKSKKHKRSGRAMPDISNELKTEVAGTLSQVGMGKIEMPIWFACEGEGESMRVPALIDAYVSLDAPEAKGIHMSRLYLELKSGLEKAPVGFETIQKMLARFIERHQDLSRSAYININFSVPLERKALVSGEVGYRQYPVNLKGRLENGRYDFSMGTEVLYSSTCPCSTALARQLMHEAFLNEFVEKKVDKSHVSNWLQSEKSIVAFPHAQRSLAKIEVRIKNPQNAPCLVELIDLAENALGTPVQAAVKRSDEQEFARLNAENLMFCEDAARKLKNVFENDKRVTDYFIHVEHQESLHPHDAISRVVKGVKGGFSV